MKTKRLITLVVSLCLIVAVATILLFAKHSKVTAMAENNERTITNQRTGQQLAQPTVTNVTSNENDKTNAAEEGYFEKIIDPETGQCVIVGLDKQTITSKDKSGNVLWTVNLANDVQNLGVPVGRHITEVHFAGSPPGLLTVIVGKLTIELDVHTGKGLGAIMH
jgi:hypothetical protein